jgi:hypothetical protein
MPETELMRFVFFFLFLLNCTPSFGSDTVIKVHFIYGSKPMHQYRSPEKKWFGGIHGGHVGIEGADGWITSFLPEGRMHIFPDRSDPHGHFTSNSSLFFYRLLDGRGDSVAHAIVVIPVTATQVRVYDSLVATYLANVPYDYAFAGMRCAAAAYDILAQTGVVAGYSRGGIARRMFYPRRLRKRLFAMAAEKGWRVEVVPGRATRKWERDR